MMDMKKLIVQMDAIETGKKFIAESVAPVKEYKGGTDAEKIKNWQQHIKNFDAFPKAQDDARQAAKKAQPGAKFYKTDDKPKKEGMGSIARALMQDMAVDEEGDPAWYGPGGANLMTGEPTAPGTGNPYKDIKAWNRDRLNQRAANRGAAATQAAANANPEVYGYGGAPEVPQGTTAQPQSSDPAAQAAAAGTPEMNIGQGATPAQAPVAGGSEMDTPAPAGITPASQAKPAASTAPAAPAKTGGMSKAVSDLAAANNITNPNMIKVGQQLKMPDGSTYVVKPGDTLGKIAGGGKQVAASPQPTTPSFNRAQDSQAANIAGKVKPGTVQNVPRRPTVVGQPSAKVLQWDQLYGATHNPDGTPKVQATQESLQDDRILAMIRDIRI